MNDEAKIRSILSRIETLHQEVESLLPAPKPSVIAKEVPVVKFELPTRVSLSVPAKPKEPSCFDRFCAKVEDWFYVRGDFAPQGMTREFAMATRWLVRTGSVILVGAIVYFLLLAIDRGWIGPVQRTYSMMAWGIMGIAVGTWLKVKSGRYALLGEGAAALGLVGLYLSFGLGHRYFNPPVISSPTVAFVGLVVATIVAGILSVRLKSLMIAILGLIGGLIVPYLVAMGAQDGWIDGYLAMLVVGTVGVAHGRRWTLLGFLSIVAVYLLRNIEAHPALLSCLLACTLVQTLWDAKARSSEANGFCWAFVSLAAIVWGVTTLVIGTGKDYLSRGCGDAWMYFAGWTLALTLLAGWVRKHHKGRDAGLSVLLVLDVLFASAAIICGMDVAEGLNWLMMVFCVFASLLADIGVRTRERVLQQLSVVMFIVLIFSFMAFSASCLGLTPLVLSLKDRIRYLWLVPFATGFAAWRLGGEEGCLSGFRKPLIGVAGVLAWVVLTIESLKFGNCYLPFLGAGLITIVWALIASALLLGGVLGRQKECRLSGLALLALSIGKLLFYDTASLATLGRVGVFAAVGLLLIAGAFLYLKFKSYFET